MNRTELEKRTKDFALPIIPFVAGLPKTKVTDVLAMGDATRTDAWYTLIVAMPIKTCLQ